VTTTARPHQLVLEPDAAREHILNLLRRRAKFAVELDETARDRSGGSLKDVVCIAIGGEFIERPKTHDYAHRLTCQSLDDASHFALNCLSGSLCFAVAYERHPDKREEWMFTAERRKRGA
jgi:hypothetical protein